MEEGRSGRYVGTCSVTAADVQPTRGLHRVVAHLSDALGRSELAGPEIAVVGLDGLIDKTPPAVTQVSHDGWKVADLSGKLVGGDVVTVTLEGEPAGCASCELSKVAGRVAMKETSPGVYAGSFTVPWDASGAAVPVTAYLADEGGNETALVADRPLSFDTRVRLSVAAKDALLPADRKSRTLLTAKAANVNGDAVQAHELALTLSTTEEYTGVVGGGTVEGRSASMEDVDDVEVRWGGMTNGWKVKAGDKVEKGQVLVTLDTRTGARGLVAPAKGVFVRAVRHERDRVDIGDTVGYVEIDPDVWKTEYGK